jgi:mannose-6-phosphate isomerase-like protein (cupin superfamily)
MHYLSCHVSVLRKDYIPHSPHSHKEEEILLLLSGKVELILPDLKNKLKSRRVQLTPGQFVFYPSYFTHSLTTISFEPANYLMIKWQNRPTGNESPLGFGCYDTGSALNAPSKKGYHHRLIFEGATSYLHKLQCHISTLTPGAGYAPHRDPYDVAIVVLAGEVETIDRRAGSNSLIFYPTGEPHGLRNFGKEVAKYIVFEFHGYSNSAFLSELTRLQRLKKEAAHILNRAAKIIRERRL